MTTAPESKNHSPMDAAVLRWLREFSAQGILITDDELNIRSCNNWLERQIGRRDEDLAGLNLLDVFPELKSRGFDRYYTDALSGQSRILSHRLHKYLLAMPPSAGSGVFAQMLYDKDAWGTYAARDKTKAAKRAAMPVYKAPTIVVPFTSATAFATAIVP